MLLRIPFTRSLLMMSKRGEKTPDTKQRSISAFFQKSEKRCAQENQGPPAKIHKTSDNNNSNNNNPVKSSLSPEQKKKIEENRQKAQMILAEKSLKGLNMGSTWQKALSAEFSKPYFTKLQQFVDAERRKSTIFPPDDEVFSWTKYFDIKDTKVVIIGQDPYHGPKQAHGLCFSVQIGVQTPPSLKNMYKELEKDIPDFVAPKHGHLVGWASQGVLLLNACLTVVAHKANSHQGKGWEQFTDATIKWIDQNLYSVVFILWGKYAEKKGSFVSKKRHLVLTGPHPSPLSASRGFFGCKHFSKANEYLKKNSKKEIDWSYLPENL